jgi:hypothetical protein
MYNQGRGRRALPGFVVAASPSSAASIHGYYLCILAFNGGGGPHAPLPHLSIPVNEILAHRHPPETQLPPVADAMAAGCNGISSRSHALVVGLHYPQAVDPGCRPVSFHQPRFCCLRPFLFAGMARQVDRDAQMH